MCRYCNTITMHHASEGQVSICVESVYGFLSGCEMGSSRFETGKVAETGRNIITDKINYARWTPVYLLDMLALPVDLLTAFQKGEFSVRKTCGGFIGTPSDMGTEHKIKELKGPSGLKHIAKKKTAMVRYSLTRHITVDWATQQKDIDGGQSHKDQGKAAMVRDDKNINKIVDQITNNIHNPLKSGSDTPELLINISTGIHAPIAVQLSILSCVEVGKIKAEKFEEKALSVGGMGKFHDPIKQSKLKSFKELSKSMKVKTKQASKK